MLYYRIARISCGPYFTKMDSGRHFSRVILVLHLENGGLCRSLEGIEADYSHRTCERVDQPPRPPTQHFAVCGATNSKPHVTETCIIEQLRQKVLAR